MSDSSRALTLARTCLDRVGGVGFGRVAGDREGFGMMGVVVGSQVGAHGGRGFSDGPIGGGGDGGGGGNGVRRRRGGRSSVAADECDESGGRRSGEGCARTGRESGRGGGGADRG